MMTKNIALKIAYDGSCFHGWQFQENALSVQETLQNIWFQLTGEKIQMNGSSRTDAGVHAEGMVANFRTNSSIPVERIHLAFNSRLPDGVAIQKAIEVPDDFHARFSSKGKKYSYYLYCHSVKPTLNRNFVAHITDKLNIAVMREAIPFLIGEKDFACFMDQGSPVHNTVRKLIHIDIVEQEDNVIRIDVYGDGFLYHMVRIIAGTLFYVGNGKIEVNDLPTLIEQGDRKPLGKTMPAHGLCLRKVFYKDVLFGEDDEQSLLGKNVF